VETIHPGITRASGSPIEVCQHWLAAPETPGEALLLVDFELSCYWLADNSPVSLTAVYCRQATVLRVAVTDRQLHCHGEPPLAQFDDWVSSAGLFVAQQGQPLPLEPVAVAKPWGRELWYTGVEQRGVSAVGRDGVESPLPWLMAVLPQGQGAVPLILLKILQPYNEPVRGDLYFELHREKREVYVVTHVDEQAWPDGVGYLRYGFSADKLARYPDDKAFRTDYLSAVQAYEAVRRSIDAMPREELATSEVLHREARLRNAMDDFTYLRPVIAGEVIAVPLLLPHALQHGVHAVEFQTPVYEREILSFAQRVLTQEHWDTAAALDSMQLLAPPDPAPLLLQQGPGLRLERVAEFEDFQVRRLTLARGVSLSYEVVADYCLLLVIAGQIELGDTLYGAEQAALLPAGWGGQLAALQPAPELVLLLATPG
jgi:hypothetical protein